jgi:hypothetical protein
MVKELVLHGGVKIFGQVLKNEYLFQNSLDLLVRSGYNLHKLAHVVYVQPELGPVFAL